MGIARGVENTAGGLAGIRERERDMPGRARVAARLGQSQREMKWTVLLGVTRAAAMWFEEGGGGVSRLRRSINNINCRHEQRDERERERARKRDTHI